MVNSVSSDARIRNPFATVLRDIQCRLFSCCLQRKKRAYACRLHPNHPISGSNNGLNAQPRALNNQLHWHTVSHADSYCLHEKSIPLWLHVCDTLRCFHFCDFHSERQEVYVVISVEQAVRTYRQILMERNSMQSTKSNLSVLVSSFLPLEFKH